MTKQRVTTSFHCDLENLEALKGVENRSDFLNMLLAENIHRIGDNEKCDTRKMVERVALEVMDEYVPKMMEEMRKRVMRELEVK